MSEEQEDDFEHSEEDEDIPVEPPKKKSKKAKGAGDPEDVMKFGRLWYGDRFHHFMKVGECRHLLPAFKDLYYERKIADKTTTTKVIVNEFNKQIAPEILTPYPTQMASWTKKWNRHILEQLGMKEAALVKKGEVHQLIKVRAQERALAYGIPEDTALEEGVRTLAGELINDAAQMLRDDQDDGEQYDTDELIKRRNYVVNVLGHTTRMVQGKAALLLKANQEKRETAGFLMDLMRQAASGKLTKEEMSELRTVTVVAPVVHEHVESNA